MAETQIIDNVYSYTKKDGTVVYRIRRYNSRTKKSEMRSITPPSNITSERKLKVFLTDERNKFFREIDNGLSESDARITLCAYFEGPVKDMFTGRSITWEGYEGHYRRYVKDWFGNLRIADINKVVIKKYFDHLENECHVGNSTYNAIIRLMRKILNQAVEDDLLIKTPLTSKVVKMKEVVPDTRCLSEDELDDLTKALNSENLYWRSFVMLLITTGIRRGEALGLHWDEVFLEEQYPFIRIRYSVEALEHQKPSLVEPKTSTSNRDIFIPEMMTELLRELKDVYGYGLVFHGLDGPEALRHPDSVNSHFKRMCKRNDLPNLSPHVLRRTLATSLATKDKVDPKTLQTILGHADIRTLLKFYVLPDGEAQRDATKNYNRKLGKAVERGAKAYAKEQEKLAAEKVKEAEEKRRERLEKQRARRAETRMKKAEA